MTMTSVVDLLHTATLDRGCGMVILSRTEYGWQASVRQRDGVTYRVEVDRDPIEAFKRALQPIAPTLNVTKTGTLTYAGTCGTPDARAHNDLFGPLR